MTPNRFRRWALACLLAVAVSLGVVCLTQFCLHVVIERAKAEVRESATYPPENPGDQGPAD